MLLSWSTTLVPHLTARLKPIGLFYIGICEINSIVMALCTHPLNANRNEIFAIVSVPNLVWCTLCAQQPRFFKTQRGPPNSPKKVLQQPYLLRLQERQKFL